MASSLYFAVFRGRITIGWAFTTFYVHQRISCRLKLKLFISDAPRLPSLGEVGGWLFRAVHGQIERRRLVRCLEDGFRSAVAVVVLVVLVDLDDGRVQRVYRVRPIGRSRTVVRLRMNDGPKGGWHMR